jgi:pimeloyl-ACP methyl ester carboxylesterase
MKKWLKRISLGIVSLVVVLLLVGFTYEQVSRYKTNSAYSPEGEFVDVGGHRLHFLRQGSGGPTVVFESGLDSNGHLPWYKVEEEVSRSTTTVSYDRAGVLWSERGDKPKTGEAMGVDLANMLEQENFPKPYIIVGHSIAGITLPPFVTSNAEDVAAVVLVDASHYDQLNRLPAMLFQTPPRWIIDMLIPFGVARLITPSLLFPNTNAEDRINNVGVVALNNLSGTLDEMGNVEALADEASNLTSFGNIPVVVITGASPTRNDILPEQYREESARVWNELQVDHLNLSTDSLQILAMESGHYVQIDEPEVVIDVILDLVTKIRN